MAKVYTGKVAIPGDKIQEYLKLLEEAEKEREPFRRQLVQLTPISATATQTKQAVEDWHYWVQMGYQFG